MTLEERVARLEQRIDQLDRIENAVLGLREDVGRVEHAVNGLRSDFGRYAADNASSLGRILTSIDELQRRPVTVRFRWPWEPS